MAEPVTVTIVNYNGRDYIADCLAAVEALSPRPQEIIVVDNASTDGSAELIESDYPHVRLVRLDENLGPCPARNKGLEEARTRLVFQLDVDVMVTPDCLEKTLHAWEQTPGVVLAQPRSVFDDQRDVVHYDGGFFHYIGLMTLRHFYGRLEEAEEGDREVDAVISLALLVDREVVLEMGGYDSSFFILFEDHDISYRLRALGHRILSVGNALVYHRHGTAGISYREGPQYPSRRAFLHSRNRWIVLLKNHHLWTLIATAPGLMVFEAAWFLFALKKRLIVPYLHGKLALIRELPGVFRARRDLMTKRTLGDGSLLGAEDLTITPLIDRKGGVGRAERCLNACLRGWWRVVRAMIPR